MHQLKNINQKKFIFIQSHPIQYAAPFYSEATKQKINIEVWYCSDESLRETMDVQFEKKIKWDIPLLNGYNYKFFKNYSYKPSINSGFFGLVNFKMVNLLFKYKKSIVVVPGWNYASYWIAIIAAKIFGHKLAIRCESPLNQELRKGKLNQFTKKIILGSLLFKMTDYFFYIGTENLNFYKYYNVKDKKLIFVPYSVDNLRFQSARINWNGKRDILCQKLNLDPQKSVVLFTGKFIEKKRPLDLLKAVANLDYSKIQLVMVGDGKMKTDIIDFIHKHNLEGHVILPGFINQSEIVKYYAVSDIFVMCSGQGETWGLSVNEAMNFGIKLIISNTVGCSIDLLKKNKTGWSFDEGDIMKLTKSIELALNDNEFEKENCFKIINEFSYQTMIDNLKSIA
jgi:glycosyltransferase involved in cell wall biosynthesis